MWSCEKSGCSRYSVTVDRLYVQHHICCVRFLTTFLNLCGFDGERHIKHRHLLWGMLRTLTWLQSVFGHTRLDDLASRFLVFNPFTALSVLVVHSKLYLGKQLSQDQSILCGVASLQSLQPCAARVRFCGMVETSSWLGSLPRCRCLSWEVECKQVKLFTHADP